MVTLRPLEEVHDSSQAENPGMLAGSRPEDYLAPDSPRPPIKKRPLLAIPQGSMSQKGDGEEKLEGLHSKKAPVPSRLNEAFLMSPKGVAEDMLQGTPSKKARVLAKQNPEALLMPRTAPDGISPAGGFTVDAAGRAAGGESIQAGNTKTPSAGTEISHSCGKDYSCGGNTPPAGAGVAPSYSQGKDSSWQRNMKAPPAGAGVAMLPLHSQEKDSSDQLLYEANDGDDSIVPSMNPPTACEYGLQAAKECKVKDDNAVLQLREVHAHSETQLKTQVNEAPLLPQSLNSFGVDVIVQIFGWLPLEDLVRLASTSRYLSDISKSPSLRGQLRAQHSARQKVGPFLGVLIQRGAHIYLQSPELKRPLKDAALSLSNFLLAQTMEKTNFILKDCRDGKLLMTTDKQCTQFVVCSPFEEQYYHWLPKCPMLAPSGEDLVAAAFIPDDCTRHYTVIALAVQISDRSEAYLKKFESKANEWACSVVQCAFLFPKKSILCNAPVICQGYVNILNPSVGVIRVNIQNLMIGTILLPVHDFLPTNPRRHQIIFRTRSEELCLAAVRMGADITARGLKKLISIYVFDKISEEWRLENELPAPKSIPCLSLIGSVEGHDAIIVGTGWDALYMLKIKDGCLSQEIRESGAGTEVFSYEIEYPSTSWWEFSR